VNAPRVALVAGLALGAVGLGAQPIQPRMGDPVPGLGAAELNLFQLGRNEFGQTLTAVQGLGPIMNDHSCASCHSRPRVGGFSAKRVTRFGKAAVPPTPFDPLESLGGSLLQAEAISVPCQEVVPPQANVTAQRLTTPVFGAGLVEAIVDGDIQARETSPPPGVSGRAHLVTPLEGPPGLRVGRFGWKAQVATLLTFSADASLNELGLTNRFLTAENAPNGNGTVLALCDSVPDPEDGPDGFGFHRIDRQRDFQRFLAAPPQTPRAGMRGETAFIGVGCAGCHVATPYVTGPSPVPALAGQSIKPYSDFLLHDVGALGDGIVQGQASESELRTPALWGLRVRAEEALLHDGSATGGTPAENVRAAILAHDGEAAAARDRFTTLRPLNQQRLIDFALSLGRAEFDYEGDHDVDAIDFVFLRLDGRFTGPGSFHTPDDPGAVADFDQDGDFDLEDYAAMQRAATGDESGSLEAERIDDAEKVRRAELRALDRPLWDPAWGAARVE
jgi:hypothetical protein